MEFCPKCGTILIPTKVNRAAFLICPRCGHKSRTGKNNSMYKISEKVTAKHEVAIIIDKKKKQQKKSNQREYEIEPPEYEEDTYE